MPIRVPVKGQTIKKTYTCPRYPDDPVAVELRPLDKGARNALRAMGFGPLPPVKVELDREKLEALEVPAGMTREKLAEMAERWALTAKRERQAKEQAEAVQTTEADTLAAARAAFVAGVASVSGVEWDGLEGEPSAAEEAGLLWDYADHWFTEAIAHDLVSLNSAGAVDLGK